MLSFKIIIIRIFPRVQSFFFSYGILGKPGSSHWNLTRNFFNVGIYEKVNRFVARLSEVRKRDIKGVRWEYCRVVENPELESQQNRGYTYIILYVNVWVEGWLILVSNLGETSLTFQWPLCSGDLLKQRDHHNEQRNTM